MKLQNITDVKGFFDVVNQCKGTVELVTTEGDVLNLKSKLCQMLGLANILQKATISEATIRCANKEDESLLFRFNLYQEVPESK